MQPSVFLIVLGVAVVAQASNDGPKGLHFLGVGYNLLEGNPEGGESSNGGVDPGLLNTRKVFKLTWDTNKQSVDRKYIVPDQVSFTPRQSCVETINKEVLSGSKSYQEKLSVDVEASGGYDAALWNVAFSLSSRFEEMKKETSNYHNVFYEEKSVCNLGRARYQLVLAPVKRFPVSEEFAAAVCVLPEDYEERTYFDLIERWGTHIVVEVELGTKTIERSKSSLTEFTKYAMQNVAGSVSVSGGFMGFSASLKVDVETFREKMSTGTKFGEHKKVYTSGGADMPEPIGLKLVPLSEAFNVYFYSAQDIASSSRCAHSESLLRSRRANVQKALKEYPRLKNAVQPVDPEVVIPLAWPKGTYGLPMLNLGCPSGTMVEWHEGTRYHDTENDDANNEWSSSYNLAGVVEKSEMEQKFCMKTKEQATGYDLDWPKGKYCIFKKGDCPTGFKEGYIYWDDEDTDNGNKYSGTLPDGTYDDNTRIEYCCRKDGYTDNAIILPTGSDFVLFKFDSHQCQKVKGMPVSSEYFKWSAEDSGLLYHTPEQLTNYRNSGKTNSAGGWRPYGTTYDDIKLHYCIYYHELSPEEIENLKKEVNELFKGWRR